MKPANEFLQRLSNLLSLWKRFKPKALNKKLVEKAI